MKNILSGLKIRPFSNSTKISNWTTRKGSPRGHIYKKTITGNQYYVVALHRDNKYKSKYFKTRTEAVNYVQFVKQTRSFKNIKAKSVIADYK